MTEDSNRDDAVSRLWRLGAIGFGVTLAGVLYLGVSPQLPWSAAFLGGLLSGSVFGWTLTRACLAFPGLARENWGRPGRRPWGWIMNILASSLMVIVFPFLSISYEMANWPWIYMNGWLTAWVVSWFWGYALHNRRLAVSGNEDAMRKGGAEVRKARGLRDGPRGTLGCARRRLGLVR